MEATDVQGGPMIPGRRILTADDLFDMKDARPRFEQQRRMKTPDGEQGEVTSLWGFTIDGMLNGSAIQGALFANSMIVIQAKSFEAAFQQAKEGLAETIRLLREDYDAHAQSNAEGLANQGISLDAAGRKGQGADGTLRTDPKLKRMLGHLIGGEPWKQ